MSRNGRTKVEKRDGERTQRAVDRIEHVVNELLDNARAAGTATHGNLAHQIAEHNIAEFLKKLETANGILNRSVWRMAKRRSYESLARWVEDHAIGTTVSLELLRGELQRRSAKLDESETEDERAEHEELDRAIDAEERAAKVVARPSTAERIQEVYSTRGMGRR